MTPFGGDFPTRTHHNLGWALGSPLPILPFQAQKENYPVRVIVYPHCADLRTTRTHHKNPSQEPITTWAGCSAQHYESHQLTHGQRCLFIFLGPAGHPTQLRIAEHPLFWEYSAPGSPMIMIGTTITHRSLATLTHTSHNRWSV